MRGWVELQSSHPQKPLPAGWETLNALPRWTLYIARFWRNQLASIPGLAVVSTMQWPIAFKMTPVDPPYPPSVWAIQLAHTDAWWASARAAYLGRLRSSAQFAAVPDSIADLFRSTQAKVSTSVQSQTKLLYHLAWPHLYQTQEAPEPMTGRLFEAFIAADQCIVRSMYSPVFIADQCIVRFSLPINVKSDLKMKVLKYPEQRDEQSKVIFHSRILRASIRKT